MTSPERLQIEHAGARHGDTPVSALARLELSRARMREALTPPPVVSGGSGRLSHVSWLEQLERIPLIRAVVESVGGWWSEHPWNTMAVFAGEASSAVARPLAQRYPFALVLVAAAVGAALAWRRPWRWLLKPALLAGLLPRLVARVVSKLPVASWMTVLDSAMSGRRSTNSRGAVTAATSAAR